MRDEKMQSLSHERMLTVMMGMVRGFVSNELRVSHSEAGLAQVVESDPRAV